MQVHNEDIAKVTIFKQLISITTYLISVFGGQLGGLGDAPRECRCIGNTLDSTTTTHRAKSSPGELVVYII